MALIEYDINYVNGKADVTYKVIEVDKGDRIRFKSNDKNTGIQYKKESPFNTPDAPQPDVAFHVGAGVTPAFTVATHLTAGNKIHFDCGSLVKAAAAPQGTTLQTWGSGNGTPPDA
jgi:hypothetical protein